MKPNNIHDIRIKIACLLFAFFFWIYVMVDLDPVDTRQISSVDVKITNIKDLNEHNLVLSPNQTLKSDVILRGRRSIIAKKIKDGVILQTTIENAKLGENISKIVVPSESSDITYTLTPNILNLNIEENKTKIEKIQINSIGKLSDDTVIDSIKLSKDSVSVSGPKSLVEKLAKVEAQIDLENSSNDITKWINLRFLDIAGNDIAGLYSDTSDVLVNVDVLKEKTVSIYANILNDDPNIDPNSINISISQTEITIRGEENELEKISRVNTKPVSLTELIEAKSLEIGFDFPENIKSNINKIKVSINS